MSFSDQESIYSRTSMDSEEMSFDMKDRSTGYIDTSKVEIMLNQSSEVKQIEDDFSTDYLLIYGS